MQGRTQLARVTVDSRVGAARGVVSTCSTKNGDSPYQVFPRAVMTVQPTPILPRMSEISTPSRAATAETTGFALVPTVEQHWFVVPGAGGDEVGAAAARVCNAGKHYIMLVA